MDRPLSPIEPTYKGNPALKDVDKLIKVLYNTQVFEYQELLKVKVQDQGAYANNNQKAYNSQQLHMDLTLKTKVKGLDEWWIVKAE